MLQTCMHCPSCRQLLYEYDFEIEGEVFGPEPNEPFHCDRCGWQGLFRDLCDGTVIPEPEPELDFQI